MYWEVFLKLYTEIVGHFAPVSDLQLVIHILDDFTLAVDNWMTWTNSILGSYCISVVWLYNCR